MAKISKTVVDSDLRSRIFNDILNGEYCIHYVKVNDRQYGCIVTDLNGVKRYVRIGAIVAEEREDMTARELMQSEINLYEDTQKRKAEKAKTKAEKIAKDEAKRKAQAEKGE